MGPPPCFAKLSIPNPYKNREIENVPLKKIFENDLRQMKKISERFRKIFEEEEKEKTNILPRILKVDPLYSNYTGME